MQPWKVFSKASIASNFASKVKNENDAIRNRISDLTSDVFLNRKTQ